MSVIDKILTYVTDSKKRLSSRATIIILSLVLMLFIDNIIGFSEHYNTSRELERLESITKLLKDNNLRDETKDKLLKLEKETLSRKNIIDYSVEFISSISWNSSKNKITDKRLEGRSNFWFLISSSGFYILATLFVAPILLFLDKETPTFSLIATVVTFVVIMIFTSWFNYWLFGKIIPDKLFGSWIWNYVANIVVQLGLVFGYIEIDKYSKRKQI